MSPKPASSWQSCNTNLSIGQLNATVNRFLTTLPDTPEKSVFSSPVTVRPQTRIASLARRIPNFQGDTRGPHAEAVFDWTEDSEEKRESHKEGKSQEGTESDGKKEPFKDDSLQREEGSEGERESFKNEKSQRGEESGKKREPDNNEKSQKEEGSKDKRESDKDGKSQREEEVSAAEREEASGGSWGHYQAERKRKGKLRVSETSEPLVDQVSSKPEEDKSGRPREEKAASEPESRQESAGQELRETDAQKEEQQKKRGKGDGTRAAPDIVDLSSDDEETKVKLARRKRLKARRLEARKNRSGTPPVDVDLTGDVPVHIGAEANKNASAGQTNADWGLTTQPGSLNDRLRRGELTAMEYLEQTRPLKEDLENLAQKQERERIEGLRSPARLKRPAADFELKRPLRRARVQGQGDRLFGGSVGLRSRFGVNSGLEKSSEKLETSAQEQEKEKVEGARSPPGVKRLAAETGSGRPPRRARVQEQENRLFRRLNFESGSSLGAEKQQETRVEVAAEARPSTAPERMSQPEQAHASIEERGGGASGQGQPAKEANGCRDSEQQPLSQEKEHSLGVDKTYEHESPGDKEGANVQTDAEKEDSERAFEDDVPEPAGWDDPLEDAGHQEASEGGSAEGGETPVTSFSGGTGYPSGSAAAVQTSSSSDADSAEKERSAAEEKSAEMTEATLRESRDTVALPRIVESPLGRGFASSASPSKTMDSPLGRGFVSPVSPAKRSIMWGRTFSVKTGEEISPGKRPTLRKVTFQSVFLKLVAYGDGLMTSHSDKAKVQELKREWKKVQKAKNVEELKYYLAWLALNLAREVKQRGMFWKPWRERVEKCDNEEELRDLLDELQAAVASCAEQKHDVKPDNPPPTQTDEIRLPESSDPPLEHRSIDPPEASAEASPRNGAAGLSAEALKQAKAQRGSPPVEKEEAGLTGSKTRRSSIEAEMPDAVEKEVTPGERSRGRKESPKGREEKVSDDLKQEESLVGDLRRMKRSDERGLIAAKTSPKAKKVKVTPKRAEKKRTAQTLKRAESKWRAKSPKRTEKKRTAQSPKRAEKKRTAQSPKRADKKRRSCPSGSPSSESSGHSDSADEGQTESFETAAEDAFQSPQSARKSDLMRQRLKRLVGAGV